MENTQASALLDALRAFAAQAVCIGHALSFFNLYPDGVPYIQNVAVQVFFVLSGFLIAYTLTRSQTFSSYLINRFARIYSAYLPALVVIAAVDFCVMLLGRYEFPTYLSPKVFLGNTLMLQNWPLTSIWSFPSLGSAGPLWTLAVEWHIYLFVGALYFLRRNPWLILVAGVFCTVPAWFLFGSVQTDVGTGLFSLWLLGFAGYFSFERVRRLNSATAQAICAISLVMYISALARDPAYDVRLYPLLALAFVAAVAYAGRYEKRDSRVIRVLADYSFTLYLVHYTVLYAIFRLWDGDAVLGALLGVLAANILASLLATHTEMKHKALAQRLRTILTKRASW